MTRSATICQFSPRSWQLWVLALLFTASSSAPAQPTPAADAAFHACINAIESRLNQQHRSASCFLACGATSPEMESRLRLGELVVEELTPSGAQLPGALLHHWRGTAFAAGVSAADFERLMKDFPAYRQRFFPQVVDSRVLLQDGDRFLVTLRVRQHHVFPVVMDTTYDITFGELDRLHGYSFSRSTQISEIEAAGTSSERSLNTSEGHGFLWRLNTYWSYVEQDGGLYMQIESVSLTRDVPRGLGWIVRPFVQSIPRESLEFTLRSTTNALRKQP
jgi:hypothetical protein